MLSADIIVPLIVMILVVFILVKVTQNVFKWLIIVGILAYLIVHYIPNFVL